MSSLKSFNRLCRKAFSCAAEAKKALQEWIDNQEFIALASFPDNCDNCL